MVVNPGELNKKINLVTFDETKDADGFIIKEKVIVRSIWAKATNTSGTEIIKANAEFAETKKRFLVRYTSIDTKLTLEYGDTLYDIVYTNDYNDAHEYIEIWCELKELV